MYIYYLIFSTHQKIPLFYSDKIKNLLIQNIHFYAKKYNSNIYSYSIIPCHINLILSFQYIGQHLKFEQDFKSFTHNQIIKLICQNKIDDYQFICGSKCGCRKINYYEQSQINTKLSNETFEIIKKRKRIWRSKCWAWQIVNQKNFTKLVNYSYFNPVKHHLIPKNKINEYKHTYRK